MHSNPNWDCKSRKQNLMESESEFEGWQTPAKRGQFMDSDICGKLQFSCTWITKTVCYRAPHGCCVEAFCLTLQFPDASSDSNSAIAGFKLQNTYIQHTTKVLHMETKRSSLWL